MRAAVSENVYPLLVLSDIVVFPHTIIPLLIENEKTATWVSTSFDAKEDILVSCRRTPGGKVVSEKDVYRIGVRAHILQLIQLQDGALKVFIEGKSRQLITRLLQQEDMLLAETEPVADVILETRRAEALRRLVVETFQEYCESYDIDINPEMIGKIQSQEDPGFVSDIIVSYIDLKTDKKQEILEEKSIDSRLSKIYDHLQGELDIARIQSHLKEQVKQRSKTSRKNMQQEQAQKMAMDSMDDEVASLERQLRCKNMPQHARDKAMSEIKRLRMMPPMSAEATVIRNYVDWFMALPWNEMSEDKTDILKAEEILNQDHFGLDKVKDRILEYLAVQQLVGSMKGPILCLVGPPGVGKTSLGRSIARATGRKFVRVSLGGVRDEAEIKGHRRTYIGAMPGKIIQGLRQAGTSNPVFLLDEVDKMSVDFRGDPSAALLEVLDP